MTKISTFDQNLEKDEFDNKNKKRKNYHNKKVQGASCH